MPAKDKYHDVVVRALKKDGWTIEAEQIRINLEDRRFWVDMRAARKQEFAVIIIEVKGFESKGSIVDYLYSAVGQYLLYREIVSEVYGSNLAVYMAVPVAAYLGILTEKIGRIAIEKLGIRFFVFNPDLEEIVEWII